MALASHLKVSVTELRLAGVADHARNISAEPIRTAVTGSGALVSGATS
jgi:hypothetical protein